MKRLALLLVALPCMGQNSLFITSSFNTATAATPTFSPASPYSGGATTVTASSTTIGQTGCTMYFDASSTPTTATTTYSFTTSITLYAQVRGCASYNNSAVATWSGTSLTCSPMTDSFSGSGALNSAYWTNVPALSVNSGTIVQNTGVAQASGAYKAGGAVITGCTPSSTAYVQFTVATITGTGSVQGGLLRMDTSGNGYRADIRQSSATIVVDKCTTGTCTFLGNIVCGSAFVATDVFKVSATGTSTVTLTGFRNGTSCGTSSDSSSTWTTGFDGLYISTDTPATNQQVSTFSAD